MKVKATQSAIFLSASAALVALLRTLLHTRLGIAALFLGVAAGASCWIFGLLERAVLWMWKWSGAAAELVSQRAPKQNHAEGEQPVR